MNTLKRNKMNSFSPIHKYQNILRKFYFPVFIVLASAIGNSVVVLFGPKKLMELSDYIAENISSDMDLRKINRLNITLLVIYGLGMLLSLLSNCISTIIVRDAVKALRKKCFEKINRLSFSELHETSRGNILSLFTSSIDTISELITTCSVSLVAAIILFIGVIIAMCLTNLILAVAAVITTLIGFIVIAIVNKKAQAYHLKQQQHIGKLNSHIEEMISSHTLIKSFCGEKKSKEVFQKLNTNLFEDWFKASFLADLSVPIIGFMNNIGYVSVCIIGGYLIINDRISLGVIVAFLVYAQTFTSALSQIASAIPQAQSVSASLHRVISFLNMSGELDECGKPESIDNISGGVSFENVCFTYPKASKPVIENFSLNIMSGQNVAIVGETGAGKTTLLNLILRFYEVDSGTISIDGVSTTTVKRVGIRNLFGVVMQDPWIFDGTIFENIVFGKENISRDKVISVCRRIGLYDFIQSMPDGLDTVMNEYIQVSTGQKQLITIARTFIRDAPMLILDEATSSVDSRTEVLIQNAMHELMKSRTSFVIAHRLVTIRNADIILVMKNGSIVEHGSHEELMLMKSEYYNMFNSQFAQNMSSTPNIPLGI